MPADQNSIGSNMEGYHLQHKIACKKSVHKNIESSPQDEFLSNQEVGWLQGIYKTCKERFFKADIQEKELMLKAYHEAKKTGVIDESGEVCPVVPRNVYLQAVLTIFSPLASFVDSIIYEGYQSNDLAKQFRNLLLGVQGQIENEAVVKCGFSPEAKKSISDITELLSEDNKNRLGDEELHLIIEAWRKTQRTDHLFEMSQRMEDETCLDLDPRVRQHFVESLQRLYQLLSEAERLPPGPERDEYLKRLREMAHKRVDVVDHFNEHGGQEGIDQEFVRCRLREEHDIAQGIASDPTLQSVISPEFAEYLKLIEQGYSLISVLFDEMDKEYEESLEEKKQCKKRHEQIEKIKKICRNYHIAKAKTATFYELKEYAKRKLRFYQEIISSEKRKLQAYSLRSVFAKRALEKYSGTHLFARSVQRLYEANSTYYRQMEDGLQTSLLPSYVCDKGSYDIELDLLC
ncbi:MAG: hypothetical protein HYR97_09000 [Candidatus Melainabacteria bacterium]|nr:hypothetical protein [Candidatus Melainabacteria bacterium]MBI3307748.1 hypothetical protein [Candidatus Melainabacteria bacterium]